MASLYSDLLYFSCLISWEHYTDWGDEERVHGAVAACYLKSIEKSKGEHALMIASNIREAMEKDREKEAETSFEIVVPLHIQEAIKWVTRTTGS